MANTLLELSSQEQHERIDQLRQLGVADEISLPQLVVVGDQSSGKSSLLEALTDLPFPVASDVCTRFATCITFRRRPQPEDTYKISIIPGPLATQIHKEALQGFSKEFESFSLSRESFANVIRKAPAFMSLSLPEISFGGHAIRNFYEDILNIEVSGPKQLQLSIIDLPGLFHNETRFQSTLDKNLVERLVDRFVKDSRTIILAVFNATVNLALQEVFTIAKRADPEGQRTVGVMTHCDRVQDGAEDQPISIALNRVEKLHHGWYCIRNRSPEEVFSGTTAEQRNQAESSFFKTNLKWSAIPKSRRGKRALLEALDEILTEHISKEFPTIRTEIDEKLQDARNELDGLGPIRQSDKERMQYLINLAGTYHGQVRNALLGQYSVDAGVPSKLRTLVQNANEDFKNKMHSNGYYLPFMTPEALMSKSSGNLFSQNVFFGSNEDTEENRAAKATKCDATSLNGSTGNGSSPSFSAGQFGSTSNLSKTSIFGNPTHDSSNPFSRSSSTPNGNPQERHDGIPRGAWSIARPVTPQGRAPSPFFEPRDIYTFIREEYKTNRGIELPGHVNHSLLERLFFQQSRKWELISTQHVERIQGLVRDCHQTVLSQICKSDKTTRAHLEEVFHSDWKNSMQAAERALQSILTVERTGHLKTLNDEFANNLSAARTRRIFARLRDLGLKDGATAKIEFQQLASLVNFSNEEFTIYDVHDTLKSYYNVALKRFIDNVDTLVVEEKLLGPKGPLDLFKSAWVTGLSLSDLAAVTAEDHGTRRKREDLNSQIRKLEQARDICAGKKEGQSGGNRVYA